MALKFHDNAAILRGPLVAVILLAVSLALVTAYAREGEGGPVHTVQNAFSAVAAPVGMAGSSVAAAGDSVGTAIEDLTADASTLSGLREQNGQLRGLVGQLEEYRQEAQRLQGLLDIEDQYALTSVAARVVGRSSDSWNDVVTLDKGTADGISAGLPVMSGTGLVGQVISATPHTCDVRLLTDQQSGIAVLVQSSRAEGIVRGSLEGLLYLEDLQSTAEVKVGDVIVTSGLGGSFFRGIIVGEVVSVEQQAGDTSPVIVVSSNADASSFEEVLVVTAVGNAGAADEGAASGEHANDSASTSGSSSSGSSTSSSSDESGESDSNSDSDAAHASSSSGEASSDDEGGDSQ